MNIKGTADKCSKNTEKWYCYRKWQIRFILISTREDRYIFPPDCFYATIEKRFRKREE